MIPIRLIWKTRLRDVITEQSNVNKFACKFSIFILVVIDTNEAEIIQRFLRTNKTLVTWSHLSTVFKLWGIGIGLAAISFVCELLRFRCSNRIKNDL